MTVKVIPFPMKIQDQCPHIDYRTSPKEFIRSNVFGDSRQFVSFSTEETVKALRKKPAWTSDDPTLDGIQIDRATGNYWRIEFDGTWKK